eukprot:scaffold55956_cov41-Prasinocladus_malaysianus.AAC.1
MSSKQLSKLYPQEKSNKLGVAKGRAGKGGNKGRKQVTPAVPSVSREEAEQERRESILKQFDMTS